MVQFGTRPAAVVGLLPQPLGANFDPAAAGLAAARPIGPLAEFTVGGTGDDARLLDVACGGGGGWVGEKGSRLAANPANGQRQVLYFGNVTVYEQYVICLFCAGFVCVVIIKVYSITITMQGTVKLNAKTSTRQ